MSRDMTEVELGERAALELRLENGAKYTTNEGTLAYIIRRRGHGLPPAHRAWYPLWQQDMHRRFFTDA